MAGFVEIIPEAMQEEVLDLLLPAAAGLWGFDRPVALPRRQVSKCQIFDEQDTLTITEVEQESSNLLVTVNRVRGQIFAPLRIEEDINRLFDALRRSAPSCPAISGIFILLHEMIGESGCAFPSRLLR